MCCRGVAGPQRALKAARGAALAATPSSRPGSDRAARPPPDRQHAGCVCVGRVRVCILFCSRAAAARHSRAPVGHCREGGGVWPRAALPALRVSTRAPATTRAGVVRSLDGRHACSDRDRISPRRPSQPPRSPRTCPPPCRPARTCCGARAAERRSRPAAAAGQRSSRAPPLAERVCRCEHDARPSGSGQSASGELLACFCGRDSGRATPAAGSIPSTHTCAMRR